MGGVHSGLTRYRLHISLSAQQTGSDLVISDFFSSNECQALQAASTSSSKPTAQTQTSTQRTTPAEIIDPRLGPLIIEEVDVMAIPPTSSSSTWRSKFEKSASFSVDEGEDPSSEVVFGILHLFKDAERARQVDARDGATTPTPRSASSVGTSATVSQAPRRTALDDDTGTILAVLGLPSQISAAEFLSWVEPAKESLEKMRMIREVNLSRCTVLIKFRDNTNAEEFYRQFSKQPVPFFGGNSGSYSDAVSAGLPDSTPSKQSTSSRPSSTAPLAHIVYITEVTVSTSSRLPYAYPQLANSDPWPLPRLEEEQLTKSDASSANPPDPAARLALSLAQELPTCPVCLERMDSNVTGLMTVSCQHTFHCDCLSRWGDARCPVCRYSQNRSSTAGGPFASLLRNRGPQLDGDSGAQQEDEPSKCTLCETTDDLWVCLICATVGCGRYKKGCAKQHFIESGHIYSLEVSLRDDAVQYVYHNCSRCTHPRVSPQLETSRVWDYIHDGYVHRLIQNRADGKLVELPSSSESTPSRRRPRARASRAADRRQRERDRQIGASGSSTSGAGAGAAAGQDDGDEDEYSDDDDYDEQDEDYLDKCDAEKSDGKLGSSQDKLEAISLEYQYLLLSQLESQRAYYEEQVRRLQTDLDEVRSSASTTESTKSTRLITDLENSKAHLERELSLSSDRYDKLNLKCTRITNLATQLQRDVEAERSLSRGLMARVDKLTTVQEERQRDLEEMRDELKSTKEQVSDLMFALSVRDKIEQEEEQGGGVAHELKGGDVSLGSGSGSGTRENASGANSSKKKKKKGKKKMSPEMQALLQQQQQQQGRNGAGGSTIEHDEHDAADDEDQDQDQSDR